MSRSNKPLIIVITIPIITHNYNYAWTGIPAIAHFTDTSGMRVWNYQTSVTDVRRPNFEVIDSSWRTIWLVSVSHTRDWIQNVEKLGTLIQK